MIYTSLVKEDSYYIFSTEDGTHKLFIPRSSVILIDDESGFVSIKQTGCRKTLGLYKK